MGGNATTAWKQQWDTLPLRETWGITCAETISNAYEGHWIQHVSVVATLKNQRADKIAFLHKHRIIKDLKLEGTSKDYQIQLPAPHSTT